MTDQETEKPGSSDEEYRFRPGNLAALEGRPMTTWAMTRRLPQPVGHAPGGPPSPSERSIPLESRTFGHTSVTLPHLEEPGLYLTNVAALEASRGIVQEFQYTGLSLRSLELASTQLVTGRISGIRADRVVFSDVRLNGVEFIGCDLSSLQWRDSKLSRVVFRDCKIMGGMLAGLSIENVVFEKCRLDYGTFEKVRATGPVAFSECSLDEAAFTDCDLTRAAIINCSLRSTEFGAGRYVGLDLRGSDLSQIAGTAHLSKVLITPAQADELTRALMAALEVSYSDPIRDDL